MSDKVQLDSTAAVEVAAFCWPDETWEEIPDSDGGAQSHIVHDQDPEKWEPSSFFYLYDFNDLHRAAAVLVGRGHGHGHVLAAHFTAERIKRNAGEATYGIGVATVLLPAESWARAILATVREVRGT